MLSADAGSVVFQHVQTHRPGGRVAESYSEFYALLRHLHRCQHGLRASLLKSVITELMDQPTASSHTNDLPHDQTITELSLNLVSDILEHDQDMHWVLNEAAPTFAQTLWSRFLMTVPSDCSDAVVPICNTTSTRAVGCKLLQHLVVPALDDRGLLTPKQQIQKAKLFDAIMDLAVEFVAATRYPQSRGGAKQRGSSRF